MEFRLESDSTSKTWINAIDRDGLWRVNDDVFALFCDIEYEIRRHLTTTRSVPHEGFKQEILDGLTSNEDVQFQWCVLFAELDTTTANCLWDMIIELYVTVRGFAFAGSCMELYKQSQKN